MAPGATVSVLYPKTATSTFNLDYYKTTHKDLVLKAWSGVGLKSITITKYGKDAPYSYGAYLEWDSLEAFDKATDTPATKEVMDDITNFSSEKPVLISGEVVASG